MYTRKPMRESKFVVLGAGGVGKTSLVVRFLDDVFSSTYKPTVEDCYQHTIQLPGRFTIQSFVYKGNFLGKIYSAK